MIFSAKVSESSLRMSWRNSILRRARKPVAIKRESSSEVTYSSQEPVDGSHQLRNLKVFEIEWTHNGRLEGLF